MGYILASPPDMRAGHDVEPELHEVASPRRLLLHDDSVRALRQCRTRHYAVRSAWSQHAWQVARAGAARHRKNQRHTSSSGQAYGISVHCRLIERWKGARSRDRCRQDSSGSTGQRHVFRLVQRPSERSGCTSRGFEWH
jgi:hypothetical protein